jgi:Calcineurin-like phosphoesterase
MRNLICLFLLVLIASPAMAGEPQPPLSHWVQMAPGGGAEARVVVRGPACPDAVIDGKSVPMRVRAAPDDKFPVLLCSVALNSGVKSASVLGEELRPPVAEPKRILVLGDTGCRIKGDAIQACNDPAQWPFPQVAAQAAKLKPDLVIHVGDYLYRESACPAGDARCAGSPWGDKWDTWSADFFAPGKPLLEAAPWVIARGNHEECVRAGAGFLRLIGAQTFVEGAPCTLHLAPYSVPIGPVNLVVMDNASAVDRNTPDALLPTYQADFAALPKFATQPTWLVMHHPIWGVARFTLGIVLGGNSTLMAAEDTYGIPPNVNLMLAGHIHVFEAMNYTHNLPPQLIVGEGGDNLDDAPPILTGLSVGTTKITDGFSLPGYGFLLMTRDNDHWNVDVFDASGAHERSCTYASRRMNCPRA